MPAKTRRLSFAAMCTLIFSGGGTPDDAEGAGGAEMEEAEMSSSAGAPDMRLVQQIERGDVVFGRFSGEHTPEGGSADAGIGHLDFVFYSLETGPFDMAALESYLTAMAEASGDSGAHPLMLRIPPIRNGHDEARNRAGLGVAAGATGIVYPHVETAEEAALAVEALGGDAWPGNPEGHLISLLLIEDQAGIDDVREIVSTPGVAAVSPGPGDLRRLYGGDMEKVEQAIQSVLAACLEFDVPCGITAGEDDVAGRIAEGFRIIITTNDETVMAGRAAAGQN